MNHSYFLERERFLLEPPFGATFSTQTGVGFGAFGALSVAAPLATAGGPVFKAHRRVSLNSRLESNKEEDNCGREEMLVSDGGEAAPRPCRGTSLKRNRPPLGTYSRAMPRALRWS